MSYLFKNRKNPVYINNLLIIIGISRCECQTDFDGRHSKLYLTQKCQKDATRHGSNHTLRFRYTQSYIQCKFYPHVIGIGSDGDIPDYEKYPLSQKFRCIKISTF